MLSQSWRKEVRLGLLSLRAEDLRAGLLGLTDKGVGPLLLGPADLCCGYPRFLHPAGPAGL